MTFKDTLEETYAALSANRVRSSLTILGIVIGISSVIALVSVGQGASASISSSVAALGSNLLEVMPGATRNIGAGVSAGRGTAKTLTQGDADAILSSVSNVQAVSDEVSGSYQIVANGNNTRVTVDGVNETYPSIRNVSIDQGSLLPTSKACRSTKWPCWGLPWLPISLEQTQHRRTVFLQMSWARRYASIISTLRLSALPLQKEAAVLGAKTT